MQADFSRWTFDRRAGLRSVLLQQGRVLLDADWNEQTQITAQHDELRTLDAVGRAGAPAGDAAFGITGGPAWADLRLTPGRFYLDGVLVTVAEPTPVGAQPYLPVAEPTADGRYAVVLEAFSHQVTADEAPRLLESALGGPDTTTREQTVWQVRLVPVGAGVMCAAPQPWLNSTPPTMTASLQDTPAGADPCRITTAEGYRRLENQLYRVQVHAVPETGPATFLWSRENGSVVAGLTEIDATTAPGMDAELGLDREGRDEELSIREGDLVEVTSVDRQLHGLSGFLADAGAPDGLRLPVNWRGSAPTGLTALGRVPLVRRWEGGATAAGTAQIALEDGIQVRFGAGDFRVGDHWLIPARTVRLVYGVSALSGTIEWPVDGTGAPVAQPPLGPLRRRSTLAMVDRAGGAWTVASDCRKLFPPLTSLVTIDLLGGDGQESLPGVALPHPIRVAVRNGALPVVGATVEFRTTGGHLRAGGAPTTGDPATLSVVTDAAGQAEARWRLATTGAATRTLTAQLLDDAGTGTGATVQVSARRSVAAEVGYDPRGCEEMAEAGIDNVQAALDHLCARRSTWPGLHVERVIVFIGDDELENDTVIEARRLLEGFGVVLDGPVAKELVTDKPVLSLALELPWPTDPNERELWGGGELLGTHTVTLTGRVGLRDDRIVTWSPPGAVVRFLNELPRRLGALQLARVQARITLLGNVVGDERGELFVNGLTFGALRGDGSTALKLPSVDDVHGANFTMWFWIGAEEVAGPPRIRVTPASLTFGSGRQTLPVTVANVGGAQLEVKADARTTSPPGTQGYIVEPDFAVVAPGQTATFAVTSLRGGPVAVFAGQLVLESDDPDNRVVTVPLSSPGFGLVPVRTGALRLRNPRDELLDSRTTALVAELRRRDQVPTLRVAVAPGYEDAVPALRERLAADGIELEVIQGDPVAIAARASAGELVLDAVVGDEEIAGALGRSALPIVRFKPQ